MGDFSTEVKRKARKSHRCECCRQAIVAGSEYLSLSGVWQGDFHHSRQHIDCRSLWNAVFDHWGDPWDGMAYDLVWVFLDQGDRTETQAELNAHRGFWPHAVNRMEWAMRDWLQDDEARHD